MSIITLEQAKKEKIWNEIKSILKKHGMTMNPKITISPMGLSAEIELLTIMSAVIDDGATVPGGVPGNRPRLPMPAGSGGSNNG